MFSCLVSPRHIKLFFNEIILAVCSARIDYLDQYSRIIKKVNTQILLPQFCIQAVKEWVCGLAQSIPGGLQLPVPAVDLLHANAEQNPYL
jgi:hypothetical protein